MRRPQKNVMVHHDTTRTLTHYTIKRRDPAQHAFPASGSSTDTFRQNLFDDVWGPVQNDVWGPEQDPC